MTTAVACWTVASVAHAFASGFWSLSLARAALGFGEGATFPGGLRTVVQTLPPDQRGRGLAVAYSGGSLGAVITPLVVTPIFLWWGWRGAFWFTGLIGAAWLQTDAGRLVVLWIAGWWLLRAASQLYMGRRLGDWVILAFFASLGVLHLIVALP